MTLKNFIQKKAILVVLFTLISASFALAQNKSHLVRQGETLYRISVNYGITVEQILNANPGISSQGLKAGAVINIPSAALAFADGEETAASPTHQQKHIVKKKETLWSISQQYGVTVDDIKNSNPQLAPDYILKKDVEINIPQSTSGNKIIAKVQNPTEIKVAVILPITQSGVVGNRSVEFYRGFLLAAEDLKNAGHHIKIFTYSEKKDSASMVEMLNKVRKNNVQLLVGPLYLSHFGEVSKFAKEEKTKVLIPFSSKVKQEDYNEHLYMLNTPEEERNKVVAEMFMKQFPKDSRIIFMGEEMRGNESTFTNSLKKTLSENGYNIKKLPVNFKVEDLEAYSRAGCTTVVVPNSSSIPMLKNATKCITEYRKANPKASVALLGYPEWQDAAKVCRQDMHTANTFIFGNSFFNPWSTDTKRFIERYKYWFKQDIIDTTPRMALLGYDSGLYLLNGLAQYGKKFSAQPIPGKYLQSKLDFKQVDNGGIFVDEHFMFIHYRTDGAIEKIEK